ncbi:MAG TPA: ABC transporter permease [Candidatus Sulfotelmatobacter sp.]|jgi:ABC-type lipoprotein release transport system permease subunit|nr:ABC transporter permease [Candidatus Sulfotelmatobacter sp.]
MIWKDNSLYVGLFLAFRDIKRNNPWTTALIILVISLTFFNMLFLGGILVGFASAAIGTYPQYYSGDIFIIPSTNKTKIEDTNTIINIVRSLPTVKVISTRETSSSLLEYNYQNKLRLTDLSESAAGTAAGVDPQAEDTMSKLSGAMVAGSYLSPTDSDEIIIGSNLIQKYATVRGATLAVGSKILQTADIGSRVRLTIGGVQKEVTIKGVYTTNSVFVDSRIYMTESAFREMTQNQSVSANEIAVRLVPNASQDEAKNYIIKNLPKNENVIVETSKEALPSSIYSIIQALGKLGNLVGAIALMVSAVTIFIVIYVNAITRRKFIGILKGIGISAQAIEVSYVFQALFYAVSGVTIATIFILGLLKPYFDLYPINFASINASLAIGISDVVYNGIALLFTSFISGFIPAWLVTKQNTLDAILGR